MIRKEKMPTKVFYNIESMVGPLANPKNTIVKVKEAHNRVSR